MKLSVRLFAATALITTASTVGVGVVALSSSYNTEVQRVDRSLQQIVAAATDAPSDQLSAAIQAAGITSAPVVVGLVDSQRQLTIFQGDDQLVRLAPSLAELNAARATPVTISSVPNYRLRSIAVYGGNFVVLGSSLHDIEAARDSNVLLLAGFTSIAVALSLILIWLLLRRDIGVVEGLARAARSIAKNERTDLPKVRGNSEVAQLAKSLNEMVSTLESAVTAERKSQDAMKAFIGDASHELRTPLTVIKGYNELLAESGDDKVFRAKAIDRVGNEVARMEQLVSHLLLLAQLGEERKLEKTQVDLSALVSDACGDMQTLQPERSVSLELEPGIVLTASGDHLVQLLNNLCSNIRRHTPLDARVRVRLVAAKGAVVLKIDDAGPGLTDEVYARGIEGFERFDAFASRQHGGTGLGMTIMRAIVAEHQGTMQLSRSDLGGLRTEISLPI